MKQKGIRISGVKLTKAGKVEKQHSYASVSDKLKRQSSKKVKVVSGNHLPKTNR